MFGKIKPREVPNARWQNTGINALSSQHILSQGASQQATVTPTALSYPPVVLQTLHRSQMTPVLPRQQLFCLLQDGARTQLLPQDGWRNMSSPLKPINQHPYSRQNQASAELNAQFVQQSVEELLASGCIEERPEKNMYAAPYWRWKIVRGRKGC